MRPTACTDPTDGSQRLCSCTGSCTIKAQLQIVEKRRFRGKRDDFEYERVTRQVVKRNCCNKMIPTYRLQHERPCCCDEYPEDHLGAEPCPQCGYRCSIKSIALVTLPCAALRDRTPVHEQCCFLCCADQRDKHAVTMLISISQLCRCTRNISLPTVVE